MVWKIAKLIERVVCVFLGQARAENNDRCQQEPLVLRVLVSAELTPEAQRVPLVHSWSGPLAPVTSSPSSEIGLIRENRMIPP
jgi:hypothetical protein